MAFIEVHLVEGEIGTDSDAILINPYEILTVKRMKITKHYPSSSMISDSRISTVIAMKGENGRHYEVKEDMTAMYNLLKHSTS